MRSLPRFLCNAIFSYNVRYFVRTCNTTHTLPIISTYFAIYSYNIHFALAIPCLHAITRTPSCAHHQNNPSTCHFHFVFRHGSYSHGAKFDLRCIEHFLYQHLLLQCSFDFIASNLSFFNMLFTSLTPSRR